MSFQSSKGGGMVSALTGVAGLDPGCNMVPKENKPQEQDSIFQTDVLRDWKDIEQIVEALASETNDQKVDILARRLIDALGER
jgi:hypothetical protein